MESLPATVTTEYLTEALRRSGVLGGGRVRDAAVMNSLRKLRSHTFRLRLDYDQRVADAPVSVILKMGHLDGDRRPSYANRREIAFYRDVAELCPGPLAPRCFRIVEVTDAAAWQLLLEDLTDSHFIATEWPLPPTLEQCELIVQALARFHAAWWDNPRLGVSVGSWRDCAALDQELRSFAEKFARFTDRFGEIIPSERRDLYERLLDRAPRLFVRHGSRRDLTISHGDAHPWNFFLPKNGRREDVRLIDWEDWSISSATDDLAYMMAMLWYPDRRRRFERPLLDRYHAELMAHGVSGYDHQALSDDYRLSTLWLMTRPIVQASMNIPPRVWWNNFERIMQAIDDLGCCDLLC